MDYYESMAYYGLDKTEFDSLIENFHICNSCFLTLADCAEESRATCYGKTHGLGRFGFGLWT